MKPSLPASTTPSNVSGILMMLLAISMFSFMDASLKELAAHYPAFQVSALRALASWPLIFIWVLLSTGLRPLLSVRWPLHLLRGVLGVFMMASFVYALRSLPLTTAYTLFFVAPLLVVVLSGTLLGERIGVARWAAIAVGFAGVLLALRPSGEGLALWAGLAVLLTATFYAISAVTVRILARTDSTQSMVFWVISIMAVGSLAIAWPSWQTLQSEHYLLIALAGLFGGLGQYALTEAFRRAEASVIASLEYTGLVWTVLFDAFIWNILPDGMTWLGAAIIVASGLYLLNAERRLAKSYNAQVNP